VGDRLGDNERAVQAYKEVLTVDPQNLPALKALEQLYEKPAGWTRTSRSWSISSKSPRRRLTG